LRSLSAPGRLDLRLICPNLSWAGSEAFPKILLSVKEQYLYAAMGS